VYNGARYLERALESLLGQTYRDIEVCISDNASTDETPEIIRRFAERDPRVRYLLNEANRGLVENHRRVLAMARGDYFMFAPHDDWFADDYVERCVAALDAEPEVAYVHAETTLVDESGEVVARELTRQRLQDPSPSRRYWDMLVVQGGVNWYGMARRSLFDRIAPYKPLPRSERIILTELALQGPFRLLPDSLYFRRVHEGQATALRRSRQAETRVLDPRRTGWRTTEFVLVAEYALGFLSAIFRAPIDTSERLRCIRGYARWLLAHVPGLRLADPRTRSLAIEQTGSAMLPEGRTGIGY
jgi:glycosyltransferase involved in cell wall biosynthesis